MSNELENKSESESEGVGSGNSFYRAVKTYVLQPFFNCLTFSNRGGHRWQQDRPERSLCTSR